MSKIRAGRRKAIHIERSSLVKSERLAPDRPIPLVIRPTISGIDLTTWATQQREFINAQLSQLGAILFRGFSVNSAEDLERFIHEFSGHLLEYTYSSTPRQRVSNQIYTSTEYPADQEIPLHNEMSYSLNWPMKIWFACLQPSDTGGATPIADSRKVLQRIDSKIREKFARKQVMYVRNYGEGLDLQWEDVFQTSDRAQVEAYCRQAQIECEWRGGNRLRTRQVCQAIAIHPQTQEPVWFNQAHLFHVSSHKPEIYQSLLSIMEPEDLPRNAFYGDGSPIEAEVLEHIREIYQQEAVVFPWQAGDILMLDNMLVAHGRQAFSGTRKVVVGMAEAFQNHIAQ